MKNKFILLIIFTSTLLLLAVGLTLNPRDLPSALIGKKVPHFALPSLIQNRQTITPEMFAQQVWVLNVWASWCVACQSEHHVLLQNRLPENVALVGLNYKDDAHNAIRWLKQMGGNPYHIIAQDTKGRVGIDLGVYGVPETFIIDKKGKIIYRFTGAINQEDYTHILLPKIHEALQ